MSDPTYASTVAQMSALISSWQTFIDQWRTYSNGTVTGGPAGDGYYPLSDPAGLSVSLPCPAKMAQLATTLAINEMTGAGPFTLTLAQAGGRVRIGNGATSTPISVIIPSAPVGTTWFIRQRDVAPLKFITQSGVTLINGSGDNATRGQNSSVSICVESASVVALDGDTGLSA